MVTEMTITALYFRFNIALDYFCILEPLFEQRPLDRQGDGPALLRHGGVHHQHRLLHRRAHRHHPQEREHDQVRAAPAGQLGRHDRQPRLRYKLNL